MDANPEHDTTMFLEIVLDSFAELLSNSALAGASNMVMSIFILKAVAKWRDNIVIEHTTTEPLAVTMDAEQVAAKYAELPED